MKCTMSITLVNNLAIHLKYGVLTVIGYKLHIFIVKVGQPDFEIYNVLKVLKRNEMGRYGVMNLT